VQASIACNPRAQTRATPKATTPARISALACPPKHWVICFPKSAEIKARRLAEENASAGQRRQAAP
jgi:hypothetical protein